MVPNCTHPNRPTPWLTNFGISAFGGFGLAFGGFTFRWAVSLPTVSQLARAPSCDPAKTTRPTLGLCVIPRPVGLPLINIALIRATERSSPTITIHTIHTVFIVHWARAPSLTALLHAPRDSPDDALYPRNTKRYIPIAPTKLVQLCRDAACA